jgi:hypothetical protein
MSATDFTMAGQKDPGMSREPNAEFSAKPTVTSEIRADSQRPERLTIPRIPNDLFPITSQEDLVAKLLAAGSSRGASTSSAADALPEGERAPDRASD